jgi:RND family efflux transporter MFP subunit
LAAVLLTLSAIQTSGCGHESEKQATEPDRPAAVIRAETLQVDVAPWPTIVRTQGTLFADEVAVVGAKVAGRVSEVPVDLGDHVVQGAPLATLDQQDFHLQVTQAAAQVQQARAAVGLQAGDALEQLEPEAAPPVREARAVWDEAITRKNRWAQLKSRSVVTESEFEQSIAAEQVAAAKYLSALNLVNEKIALIHVREAELLLARQRLADAVVPAPFDGIVQERHVAPGSFVQIGESIATIVRIHPLHFRGALPEHAARGLQEGQAMVLQIESIAETVNVHITRISPTIDPLSRSLMFEAEVANADGRLRAGLFAEAQVVIDEHAEKIVVPESAITQFAGVEKAWVVTEGMAEEQVVLTGEQRKGRIHIIDGLRAGEVILLRASEGRVARVEPVSPDVREKAITEVNNSITDTGE